MPAVHSWAQSQNLMPAAGKRSEIGIIAEPMMPKACSIPCICRTLMKASSVVIFMALVPLCPAISEGFVLEVVPVIGGALAEPPERGEQAVVGQLAGED